MTPNVGRLDRFLRLIVGLALIVAPLIGFMGLGASAVVAYAMIGVGGILVLTSIVGICPIYSLLRVKT